MSYALFSDRMTVEETASDAADYKLAAVSKNYYKDDYISYFARLKIDSQPHQNLGSYLRTFIVKKAVWRFHQMPGDEKRVVVLGCGYDTVYWRLRDEGISFAEWIEVDKQNVIKRKRKIMDNPVFKTGNEFKFIECDLESELADHIHQICPKDGVPTLYIDEFSLIYVEPSSFIAILEQISQNPCNCFVSYGMTNLNDDFGEIVTKSFNEYGISLKSYALTATLDEAHSLFASKGFQNCVCLTMEMVTSNFISKEEKNRIAYLDYFDDPAGLAYILRHYAVFCGGPEDFLTCFTQATHFNALQ